VNIKKITLRWDKFTKATFSTIQKNSIRLILLKAFDNLEILYNNMGVAMLLTGK